MDIILNRIFLPDDIIYMVPLSDHSKGYNLFKPADLSPEKISYNSQFCLNPIHDVSVKATPRHMDNIAAYRNFLLEIDGEDLPTQRVIVQELTSLGFKPTIACYSGGKSYHLIYSIADTIDIESHSLAGAMHYRATWLAFCAHLEGLLGRKNLFDQSTKDCHWLSRTPQAYRQDKPTKPLQEVLLSDGPYYAASTFESLDAIPVTSSPGSKVSNASLRSMDLNLALKSDRSMWSLRNKWVLADEWAKPVGNYQRLFKYTLWLIDAMKPSYESTLEFATKYTLPALQSKGYPKEKLTVAITNAYKYKLKGM